MTGNDVVKFLTLLYNSGNLSGYWKGRVENFVNELGGKIERPTNEVERISSTE